jgi:hypothetical protein
MVLIRCSDAGAAIQLIPVAATTTVPINSASLVRSNSQVSETANASSVANGATPTHITGLSTAKKIAIGTSVPVGFILISTLGLGFFCYRKKFKNRRNRSAESQNKGPLPKELGSSQMYEVQGPIVEAPHELSVHAEHR